MMKEIKERGPIACRNATDNNFKNYTNGIITHLKDSPNMPFNHAVSITGWGISSTGTKFWFARNSWGSNVQ